MSTTEYTDQTDAPEVIEVEGTPDPEPQTLAEPQEVEAAADDARDNEGPSREAAKYRRRLREAEAERDAAQGATEAAQRALVEHLAATVGRIRPEALWASGVELSALLDDAGNVDAERVSEAADVAVGALGLTRQPKPDANQGRSSAATGHDSWTQAFAPR